MKGAYPTFFPSTSPAFWQTLVHPDHRLWRWRNWLCVIQQLEKVFPGALQPHKKVCHISPLANLRRKYNEFGLGQQVADLPRPLLACLVTVVTNVEAGNAP